VPPHYGGYHRDNSNAEHHWQQQQQQQQQQFSTGSSSGYAVQQPGMYAATAAAATATATAGNEHRVMGQGLSELLGHDGAGVKVMLINVHLTVVSCNFIYRQCATRLLTQ
jgi:hypothetical protein